MAKTFLYKRNRAGMAAWINAIGQVRRDLHHADKQYGQESLQAAEHLLILSALYYVVADYKNAEPLLLRYLAIIKENLGEDTRETLEGLGLLSDIYAGLNRSNEVGRIANEANSLAMKLGKSPRNLLVEALLRKSKSHEYHSNSYTRKRGLVLALMSLCWCITRGLCATPAGAQVRERLRLLFESFGNGEEEWGWVVKRARLNKYDFLGLLSLLLYHMELEFSWLDRVES